MKATNEEIEQGKKMLRVGISIVIILSFLTVFQAFVIYKYVISGIFDIQLVGVTLIFLGFLTTTISSALISSIDYKIIKLKEKLNEL